MRPATGFFWRYDGRVFLVTNRHVVTARDESNTPLEGGFDPLYLDAQFYKKNGKSKHGYTPVKLEHIRIDLWKDRKPDWIEHQDRRNFDVVAMDLGKELDVYAVNDKVQDSEIWAEAGSDCFVVGFPEGLHGPDLTPIWKRASIASEPYLDFSGLPIFLCDSATRQGMSGAPVFLKAVGSLGREGASLQGSFFGFWTKFVGVYSGRNGNDQTGFQLGRVWKEEVVLQILQNPRKPESPFFSNL